MNADTLHLLQAADDPVNIENPPSHRWDQALERVRPLKVKLEQLTGRPFCIDENVQDASFFTDLSLEVPSAKPQYIDMVIAVRFSTFGDLFTLWSHASEQLSASMVEQIIATVQAEGFHYVDAESLDEQYSGQNPAFIGQTWWLRFFDYI